VMRIGTQGTTLHILKRPKEGFAIIQATIREIPEGHVMLRKV
jgi:hypothetical protein